ncbi:hypothetical protein TOK_1560 [Pseudonocardia sp. N23]|nr:hypothetical protein TOK_1560 [Pseudonocardia sp. N23]
MLGAAGALVAGYCITASGPDVAATHPSVLAVPELADERGWADQAEVVLASVGAQLDDVADAEAEWNALPEHVRERRAATYATLLRRKAYLETQKTLLQTQLGTYRSLARAGDELRQAQQQLAYIERELTIATDPARRTAAQAALVVALEENRRTLERRRDAKQAEMRGLTSDVRTAARVPLVDDPVATRRATAEVRRIVADPTAPAPHDASDDRRPDAVPGRPAQRDGTPSVEVGTGAPPDPGSGPVDLERLAAGGELPVVPVAHVESVPDAAPEEPDASQGSAPAETSRAQPPPADPPPADAPLPEPPAVPPAPVPPGAGSGTAPGYGATAPGVRSGEAPPTTTTGSAAGAAGMVAPSVDWMAPGLTEGAVRAAEEQQARDGAARKAPPPADPPPAEPPPGPSGGPGTGPDDAERVVG